MRLVHHANRRVGGSAASTIDSRLRSRANPLADAFETGANFPAGIVEGCRRGCVRTPHEVVARVAVRRQVSKRRVVVLANQPGVHEGVGCLHQGEVRFNPRPSDQAAPAEPASHRASARRARTRSSRMPVLWPTEARPSVVRCSGDAEARSKVLPVRAVVSSARPA